MEHQFPTEVASILAECGWFPGRDVGKQLRLPADFELFPIAELVLKEFGNIKCGKRGPGIECARSTINFDPALAEGEAERFAFYGNQIGARLYPLGEGDEGHYFIAIDEYGRVFLVMDFIMFAGDTFDAALENLLLGRKARLVNERGEW